MSGEGGRGIQHRGLYCDSSGGGGSGLAGARDVSSHPRCLAVGDKGRGQWPGAQLKCHLLRDTSPCASAVTPPPCLLPLPPRSFTAPRPSLSAPAGARHPSVLCPGTPFLPAPPALAPLPAVPCPALHSMELTLLQAVLFIPCLAPQRQLFGSSRIVSF